MCRNLTSLGVSMWCPPIKAHRFHVLLRSFSLSCLTSLKHVCWTWISLFLLASDTLNWSPTSCMLCLIYDPHVILFPFIYITLKHHMMLLIFFCTLASDLTWTGYHQLHSDLSPSTWLIKLASDSRLKELHVDESRPRDSFRRHQRQLHNSTSDAYSPCSRCQLSACQLHPASPLLSFSLKCWQHSCLPFYLFICWFTFFPHLPTVTALLSYLCLVSLECLSLHLFFISPWSFVCSLPFSFSTAIAVQKAMVGH